MSKSIQSILEQNGPMLSGELAKIYEIENSSNNDCARKAISRARTPVQKNKLIPFNKNQVFVYLEKQYMGREYWDCLNLSINEQSMLANVILKALISQGGIMSKNTLAAYSLSPIKNLKGHKRFDVLIEKLKESKIIEDYGDEYYKLTESYFSQDINFHYPRMKGIEIARNVILADFNDLLRKINMISYNKGKVYADFAQFRWCFTAPSYSQGIATWQPKRNKVAPGFIIADVILLKNATINDLQYFVEKINIIKRYKNINNFIPFIILYDLNPEALKYLKSNNIVIGFIDRLFGDGYKDLLNDLIYVVSNATKMVQKNPEKIDKIFDKLVNIDGRYNNVVGDLFELLVADYYRTVGVRCLEINKQIAASDTISGKPKEIDVLVDRDGTIIVAECKATLPMIDEDFIDIWLKVKVRDIFHYLSGEYSNRNFTFQIWSTGGFTKEAEAKLEKAKNETRKYTIDYLNKEDMLVLAKKSKAQNFIKHVEKHFGKS